MERTHFYLVIHAHWAEHKVKNIEQDDPYRDAFFLVCATFAQELYNIEAVHESGSSISTFLHIACINFYIFRCYIVVCRLRIGRFCVMIFHGNAFLWCVIWFSHLYYTPLQRHCFLFLVQNPLKPMGFYGIFMWEV